MAKKLDVGQLADAIMKNLNEYQKATASDVEKAAQKAADESLKSIQQNAPKKTGKYAKSWKKKKILASGGKIKVILHSKEHYRRAHLLENGHALIRGGRKIGEVGAIPHLEEAQELANEVFEREVKKALKG